MATQTLGMTNPRTGQRPLALITGAAGGMGIACARVFGRGRRLILNDVGEGPLAALAQELRRDGVEVAGEVVGDISAPETIGALGKAVDGAGSLAVLIHTAGLSPALADWRRILDVNLGGTLRLLDAMEPRLAPGAAGVLIASMAGHSVAGGPELDGVLAQADPANLTAPLEPFVRERAGGGDLLALNVAAYGLSKYAVLKLCERRAARWGELGARITSISPGLIATPMGLKEAATNPFAGGLAEQAPAGRWGTPLDIAEAAAFLASDAASFVTGCDLKVDGGLVAKLRADAALQPASKA